MSRRLCTHRDVAMCHSCLLLPLVPPPSLSSPSRVPPLRPSSLRPQPQRPSSSSTCGAPFTTAATLRTGHKRHVTTPPHARHPPTLRPATTHDHDSPQHIGIEVEGIGLGLVFKGGMDLNSETTGDVGLFMPAFALLGCSCGEELSWSWS